MTDSGSRLPAPDPPAAWVRADSSYPEALSGVYAGLAQRTWDQLGPGAFRVTAEVARVDSASVFRESYAATTETRARFVEPTYACSVPVAWQPDGRYFGQELPDGAVPTVEPGVDFWMVAPAGADYASLAMTETAVMRYAETLQLAPPGRLRKVPRLLDLPQHRVQALRRFALAVLANLESNRTNLRSPVAIGQMEEGAAVLLICALLGRAGLPAAGRPKASYEKLASRARDYVVSHPQQAPTLTELCDHLHVGVRALNYAFQHAVGTGAGEYLRLIRLNRVRDELLAARGGPRQVISELASRWGFWHASQFTRQYRSLFGERPTETVASREDAAGVDALPPTGRAPAARPKRFRA